MIKKTKTHFNERMFLTFEERDFMNCAATTTDIYNQRHLTDEEWEVINPGVSRGHSHSIATQTHKTVQLDMDLIEKINKSGFDSETFVNQIVREWFVLNNKN